MKQMTRIWGKLTACVCALGSSLPAQADELDAVTVTNAAELVTAVSGASDHTVILLDPAGNYSLGAPLVLGILDHITIDGNGAVIEATNDADFQNGFLIEAQGCDRLHLKDVTLRSTVTGANMLTGALLLGRTSAGNGDGRSGGRHLFENVLIDGQYEFSSVVNVCSEVNTWINCHIENIGNAGPDNSYAFYMSCFAPIPVWDDLKGYAAEVWVRPTTPNGFMYQAQNMGTSGASEPASWPTTPGFTVVDNNVTWKCFKLATGPIMSADFSGLDGTDLLLGLTMTGQTFINTHFSRFWDPAGDDPDDAVFYFDNSRGGSFGNFSFRNSWFNCNTSSNNTDSDHGTNIDALIRYNATNETTFNLSFEDCVSEGDECNSVLLIEGTTILHGLSMKRNHWTAGERIVVTGEDVSLMGARFDEDGFVTGADYNWSYDSTSPYAFDASPSDPGDSRCLYDIQNCYGCQIDGSAPGLSIQQDPAGSGVWGDLGGGVLRTDSDRRPWSIARVRNNCLHNEFITYELNDVLPTGVGGSTIPRTQIRRQDAGVFLDATVEGALTVAAGANVGVARVGGVLNVNATDVGNVGAAGPDDLMTYSLPANVLNANGKVIRVTCWGTTTGNGNTKTVAFNFGSTSITKKLAPNPTGTWSITATIIRTGSNSQYMYTELSNNEANSLGPAEGILVYKQTNHSSTSQTDTSAITIKCTATAASSTNDIVQKGMLVEALN